MTYTTISPLVHSPDEHNIVVMPDAASISAIVRVQQQLQSLLGSAIWLTPPQALHMTLMEIIWNVDYKDMSRQEHFTNWHEKYNEVAGGTIAQFQPFTIDLNELYASPAAIILKAADPKPFNEIRQALLARTVLPPQTKLPPSITHCSIARYSETVDLDMVQEKVKPVHVDVKVPVSEFKLMKDLGPDFHPTLEETYSLGA